jgi:hypothetical protein
VCYSARSGEDGKGGQTSIGFGFFPKISTPVENTVEKAALPVELRV